MRYPKGHATDVKRKLLAEGARLFKLRGVQGAGVDGVASAVGLSGAALYSHFASKKELLCEVLRQELAGTAHRFLDASVTWQAALTRYLSLAHVHAPATGCVLPSITAEVARGEDEVRRAFEEGVADVTRALGTLTDHPELSLGVLAASLGAVSLARALPGDANARRVLESTRKLITIALSNPDATTSD